MHLEQVKIVVKKPDIFTNKYADVLPSAFKQKNIGKLLEKNVSMLSPLTKSLCLKKF